jgi:hypothetical protein
MPLKLPDNGSCELPSKDNASSATRVFAEPAVFAVIWQFPFNPAVSQKQKVLAGC